MKIIIGIAVFAAWTAGVAYLMDQHGVTRCAKKVQDATLEATKKARKEEQEKQEKVNAIAKKQYDDISTINSKLIADLDRLHKRESRRNSTKDSKPRCEGTTGSSLSKEDAGFLTREAARADRIRSGLDACYKYADEIKKGKQ